MALHGITPFVDYEGNPLPVDLDGHPYRITSSLGAWRMTKCCGAAVSAGDPIFGLYCKHCYEGVDPDSDAPARLAQANDIPDPDGLSSAQRAAMGGESLSDGFWIDDGHLCFLTTNGHIVAIDRDGIVRCEGDAR